ncbi:oxygen-dependent tRNA uridine(34) hydroxylase TrhO [Roseivivax sediminis]|uniref:tRNA uridine(34) hydroxylase n=1 Tax=Roseivivax sediminis TaxID=936889 RepID=A0A1I1UN23_9RHOB|nr:rhodanese-related sulfurtransferase [Roseivivax sediminis]SFD72094.1 UPF0176 protein [Roseivivax sediminis]
MYLIAALYRFTPFDAPADLVPGIEAAARTGGVTGTLLLAPEGINGTVAGPEAGIESLLAHLRTLPGCADLEPKFSTAAERPFARLKVRLKKEIVTLGQPGVDPRARTGNYVEPAEWTEFIRSPDVAVIDTRNDYEVAIGTFEGAVDPGTASFRDFPAWWEANRHRFHNKKIAMFCTGGIRCEKSTNWLLGQGVEEVYHLKGGILKYLEEVPEEQSAWQGDCFVFDNRVSVGHGLSEGPHILCHACRSPLLPEDRAHPDYEEGVACHHCAHETSAEDKARFRERQRQIALARARGETHLTADARAE